MDPKAFEDYTQRLQASLANARGVVGLVVMGSTVDTRFLDQWSDHDFWVITETGTQDALVQDLSWLPDYSDVLLVVTHRNRRRTVLFENGHKVEFGVFDRNEAIEGKIERYRILLDRDHIAEFIEAIHQKTLEEARTREDALENLCVLVWTACERNARGELLSARQWVDGFAVNQLLSLISDFFEAAGKDPLDPRRRLETRSPALAKEVGALVGKPVPEAAFRLLQIAERELKAKAPELPWDKAKTVERWIEALLLNDQRDL